MNGDGVRWRLQVEMPANDKSRQDGEEVFREARESLRIHDL
ncbi:hypothetical protein ACF1DY_31545 [Streptomyces albus]